MSSKLIIMLYYKGLHVVVALYYCDRTFNAFINTEFIRNYFLILCYRIKDFLKSVLIKYHNNNFLIAFSFRFLYKHSEVRSVENQTLQNCLPSKCMLTLFFPSDIANSNGVTYIYFERKFFSLYIEIRSSNVSV